MKIKKCPTKGSYNVPISFGLIAMVVYMYLIPYQYVFSKKEIYFFFQVFPILIFWDIDS